MPFGLKCYTSLFHSYSCRKYKYSESNIESKGNTDVSVIRKN